MIERTPTGGVVRDRSAIGQVWAAVQASDAKRQSFWNRCGGTIAALYVAYVIGRESVGDPDGPPLWLTAAVLAGAFALSVFGPDIGKRERLRHLQSAFSSARIVDNPQICDLCDARGILHSRGVVHTRPAAGGAPLWLCSSHLASCGPRAGS